MPTFCPKCMNMLPDGATECEVCGTRLEKAPSADDKITSLSLSEYFTISIYTIGILLIGISIPLLVVIVCVLLAR